jgi:hypothetical protein
MVKTAICLHLTIRRTEVLPIPSRFAICRLLTPCCSKVFASWACLFLTADEMAERDLYVVTDVRERNVQLAMVLSGGYGPASWEAHARSIEGILARFDGQL